MINILFVGFRHVHIESLYKECMENSEINVIGCVENDENTKKEISHRYCTFAFFVLYC